MDAELEEIKQWIAPQAIRDALAMVKREKVMDHFLWCTVNLYSFMNKFYINSNTLSKLYEFKEQLSHPESYPIL